jgi:16S rRNA (cytosine967-C5)-methyltransferase
VSEISSISRNLAWKSILEYQRSGKDPGAILNVLVTPDIHGADRNLIWELTMGTIRYLKKLDFMAQKFIKAPLSKQKPEVLAALRMGLYQLTQTTGTPEYAAVDDTVEIVGRALTKRDAGFVNAVLRTFLREQSDIKYPDPETDPIDYLSIFYSYPEWLVRRWHARFGFEETEKILIANNRRPKTSFKIITQKNDRISAIENLKEDGIEVEAGRFLPDFIVAEKTGAVLRSSLFKEGYLNVQDESQGLPVLLLNPPPGETVLDLCSAPGGKTIALADRVGPRGKVVSIDINPERVVLVKQNIERIGFSNIEIIESDLFEFATTRKFRYILLDVPCGGFGTLSGNPDLKWNKSEGDIRRLSELQLKMLTKASSHLSNDGCLVYSTCTTEPEEIEEVTENFLKSHSQFKLDDGNSSLLEPFKTDIGIYRSWPHKHDLGGGGFARLKKSNAIQD